VESKRDKLKRTVRKTVKWGGAGLTVLQLVVWVGSGWMTIGYAPVRGPTAALAAGVVIVLIPTTGLTASARPGWTAKQESSKFQWWFSFLGNQRVKVCIVPLWSPALLSLLATAAAWRADAKYMRRVRVGLCAACGYDRAGLAAGAVCPECGVAAGA